MMMMKVAWNFVYDIIAANISRVTNFVISTIMNSFSGPIYELIFELIRAILE